MDDLEEIASWYRDDDHFDPSAKTDAIKQECVSQVEAATRAEGREADFAEVLLAIAIANEQGLRIPRF